MATGTEGNDTLTNEGTQTFETIDALGGDDVITVNRPAGFFMDRIIQVNAPALDAFAARDAALDGPFDLAFIDALKGEYAAYLDALVDGGRLVDGALVIADNVLWSGRVSGSRPVGGDSSTAALRAFVARVHADTRFSASVLPLGDGLLVAGYRSTAGRG